MLNKLTSIFVTIIIAIILAACSNTAIQQNSQSISYNKNKANLLESYQDNNAANIENWPFLYQNNSNKLINYNLKKNHFNFKVVAKIPLEAKYNKYDITPNIVVDNNIIYTVNGKNYLIIIDLLTNKVINKIKLSFLKNDSVVGIALSNNYLYLTTNTGKVSAVYKDGEESWTVNLLYPIQSAPLIDNNTLFVVANNTVYALNIFSGDSLWEFQGIENGISLSKAIIPTIYQNFLVVGLSNGTVLFIRKENGQLLWRYTLNKGGSLISNAIIAPPIIVNNGTNILVGSFNSSTSLLNPLKNTAIWQNTNIGFINAPVLINNHIFIVDTTMSLNNLDLQDGKSYWTLLLPNTSKNLTFMKWFGPFLVNNNILVYNSNGEFHIVSPQSGNIIANFQLNLSWFDNLTSAIAIVQEKIIVLGLKNIYIIE